MKSFEIWHMLFAENSLGFTFLINFCVLLGIFICLSFKLCEIYEQFLYFIEIIYLWLTIKGRRELCFYIFRMYKVIWMIYVYICDDM